MLQAPSALGRPSYHRAVRNRPEPTRLIIAALASIAAHAIGIAALGGSYGTLLGKESDPITAADERQEIQLGIERSDAQTIDWIGYEEYQRHIAPPSEQSQAQMELGAPAASAPATPQDEPEPPVEQSAPEAVAEQIEQAARTVEELLLDPVRSLLEDPLFFVTNKSAQSSKPEPTPAEERQQAQPPAPEPTPPADEAATTDAQPGNANKEADAVSRENPVVITEYILGKPLAAQGLDIQTVRPRWSDRTLIMARPRNPTVQIRFNHAGKVVKASIQESTGDKDVDRPLLDAIYQWRATGERLGELIEGDDSSTVTVTLAIRLR